MTIKDVSGTGASTMSCRFYNLDGVGIPSAEDEIIVTVDGTRIFAGYIVAIHKDHLGGSAVDCQLTCVDYTRDLERQLVVENYQGMTDKKIIQDIVDNYCDGYAIDTTNVETGITIDQISFNYMPPSQCLTEVCKLSARFWYIDYNKGLHYITTDSEDAPFDVTDTSAQHRNLIIKQDNKQIKNRIYVRGGEYLSDEVTITMKADGTQTVFNLPDQPHEISMTEGGAAKTIGIKHIHDPADYDYLVNYQEKYIECGSASAPAANTVMAFSYKYYIPILIAVEDKDSINSIGKFEYAILDNKIKTVDQARDRAQAELTEYASTLDSGGFTTRVAGFRAGQTININVTALGINDDYIVKSVTAKSLGNGEFEYDVAIAEYEPMGIIQFLIKLLEQDKNAVQISDDEVVDELKSIGTDSLAITDSLTLTKDSPPFKWDEDEWGFAEWY
jgi:hypothetical protein